MFYKENDIRLEDLLTNDKDPNTLARNTVCEVVLFCRGGWGVCVFVVFMCVCVCVVVVVVVICLFGVFCLFILILFSFLLFSQFFYLIILSR